MVACSLAALRRSQKLQDPAAECTRKRPVTGIAFDADCVVSGANSFTGVRAFAIDTPNDSRSL